MEIVWYLLAAFLGVVGMFGLIFSVERLAKGAGISPGLVLVGLAGLLLAWVCLRRGRARAGD